MGVVLSSRRRWMVAPVLLAVLAGLPAAEAKTLPDFEIREWFALGSGCRALPGAPGDVSLRVRARSGLGYTLRMLFPSYGLDGDMPVVPGAATFARECGVRLALYPGPGRRLRHVSAETGFVYSKDAGVRLRLGARLRLGNEAVAVEEHWLDADRQSRAAETLAVRLSPADDEALQRVGCEQPKIVGIDLSMAAFRDDVRPQVSVSVLERKLTLSLEFEACRK